MEILDLKMPKNNIEEKLIKLRPINEYLNTSTETKNGTLVFFYLKSFCICIYKIGLGEDDFCEYLKIFDSVLGCLRKWWESIYQFIQ